MTSDPPPDESETGLPDKRSEFTITLPWTARLALTAAIGAAVGFAASTVLSPRGANQTAIIAAGALASIFLSIRKLHGWQVSTFADGTIVGLAAGPLYVLLMVLPYAAFATAGQGLLSLLFGFTVVLITVPCGWLAGFVYHLLLSAAERVRAKEEDEAS